jgi:hypothetical protein
LPAPGGPEIHTTVRPEVPSSRANSASRRTALPMTGRVVFAKATPCCRICAIPFLRTAWFDLRTPANGQSKQARVRASLQNHNASKGYVAKSVAACNPGVYAGIIRWRGV